MALIILCNAYDSSFVRALRVILFVARPKARPLPAAEYKETKAIVKERRRARKNGKRYQKKKLYGPITHGEDRTEILTQIFND